jgi:serine/threonine-protein kinase PRP4
MRIFSVFYVFSRISPRPPSRARSAQLSQHADTAKRAGEKPPYVSESKPDVELEIPSTPPPVEDIIAARRAKRQAILAKYSGQASLNASPSPMPRNSAEPPPESPAVFGSTPPPKEAGMPTSSEDHMNGKLRIQ